MPWHALHVCIVRVYYIRIENLLAFYNLEKLSSLFVVSMSTQYPIYTARERFGCLTAKA